MSLLQNVKIRPFGPPDQGEVLRMVRGILSSEFPADQAAYAAADLEKVSEAYSAPNDAFLVAEKDRRVVGTCGVKAEDSRTAILRRLFVDPVCRRQGVGGRLLQEAVAFCRQRGFEEIVIRTSEGMVQAIRLCRSLGFEEDGRWSLEGVRLVRFRLRLR